ncbi:hypothetical protein HMPREF3192_00634 [Atopobium deltae]|uniref:Uncharacterized protein n=1 Tax=Atopobium deltae TaxID=1393034 RepID=A0A133XVQ4_9ACTN|nr:hypothetical protein HMPREF3192_00634 [Atopobium deltae]
MNIIVQECYKIPSTVKMLPFIPQSARQSQRLQHSNEIIGILGDEVIVILVGRRACG